ncbi:hypothetical protein MN608_03757 [Microdochium nivale]|nr:hypothetical protein MN608_03757 [Microdochium nivale]
MLFIPLVRRRLIRHPHKTPGRDVVGDPVKMTACRAPPAMLTVDRVMLVVVSLASVPACQRASVCLVWNNHFGSQYANNKSWMCISPGLLWNQRQTRLLMA